MIAQIIGGTFGIVLGAAVLLWFLHEINIDD